MRFVCSSSHAGLVSADPWAAAKEDEMVAFQQVLASAMFSTFN
jgi:hypothetical protein